MVKRLVLPGRDFCGGKQLKYVNFETLRRLFASSDQAHDLPKGNIDVEQPQAAEGAAEVGIVPEILDSDLVGGEKARKVVQAPRVHPGEHDQEGANFKRKDRKQHDPETSPPGSRRPRVPRQCR